MKMDTEPNMVTLPLEPDDDDSVVEFDDINTSPEIQALREKLEYVTEEAKASEKKRHSSSMRMSALPIDIQETARKMNLDRANDGELSVGDIAHFIDDMEKKTRSNKTMKRTIIGMVVLMIMLISCVFAASLTAARISKQFKVSPTTGLAMTGDSETPTLLKTRIAKEERDVLSIAALSHKELQDLRELVLDGGDLKFIIKGYSRDPFGNTKIILLVEGGTIIYDSHGIAEATGDAKRALEAAYGAHAFDNNGRMLYERPMTGYFDM